MGPPRKRSNLNLNWNRMGLGPSSWPLRNAGQTSRFDHFWLRWTRPFSWTFCLMLGFAGIKRHIWQELLQTVPFFGLGLHDTSIQQHTCDARILEVLDLNYCGSACKWTFQISLLSLLHSVTCHFVKAPDQPCLGAVHGPIIVEIILGHLAAVRWSPQKEDEAWAAGHVLEPKVLEAITPWPTAASKRMALHGFASIYGYFSWLWCLASGFKEIVLLSDEPQWWQHTCDTCIELCFQSDSLIHDKVGHP